LQPLPLKCQLIGYHQSSQNQKDTEIIYEGNLLPIVKMIKVFSISTSLIGLVSQPFIMSKLFETELDLIKIGFVTVSSIFILCSPLLLNLITKRYVYRLNYNSKNDEYTAYTLSFFNQKVELTFKRDQVHFPMVPGLFTTFIVNSKIPLFVDSSSITNVNAYQRLMGFDKNLAPIDVNKEKQSSD
jgi:transmembrane protein 70 homolog, mitochondrial